jgi:hypothetical protein
VRAAGPALVWLLLLGVYATTLGIPSTTGERYAGDEPHHLLAARSIASDGDVDLANQYAARDWRAFSRAPVTTSAAPVLGRLHEPQGIGVGAVGAGAYALGGDRAVALEIAAVVALGFALAVALARRLVPDPWATGGVLLDRGHAADRCRPLRAARARAGAAALRVRRRGDARGPAVAQRAARARGPARRGLPRALDLAGAPAPRGAPLRGARPRLARRVRADR